MPVKIIHMLAAIAAIVVARGFAPLHEGLLARVAWYLGMGAVAGVLLFPPAGATRAAAGGPFTDVRKPGWSVRHVSLNLGVAAAIVLLILLTMRLLYFTIDVIHGYPWQGARDFGFGAGGLLTIGALCIACFVGLAHSREGKLATAQFWLLMLLAVWACQLSPAFQPTETGGFQRTDATLNLVECVSYLIPVSVLLVAWLVDYGFLRAKYGDGDIGNAVVQGIPFPCGFRTSVAVVALGLNVALLYQMLVPAGPGSAQLRMSAFRVGSAALIASLGGLALLRRTWSAHLADAVLGLFALAICGMAALAVPDDASPLAQQYPMIFNAMVVGYAFAAALFTHWTVRWSQSNLPAQSLRVRFVPHLKRFCFLSGAMSLLAGVMMCFWPGMPGIFAMDHSLGRVIAGVAAFLFLLFVSLRAGRLMARVSFHILTLAVVASMVAFLLVRAFPFMSEHPHG